VLILDQHIENSDKLLPLQQASDLKESFVLPAVNWYLTFFRAGEGGGGEEEWRWPEFLCYRLPLPLLLPPHVAIETTFTMPYIT